MCKKGAKTKNGNLQELLAEWNISFPDVLPTRFLKTSVDTKRTNIQNKSFTFFVNLDEKTVQLTDYNADVWFRHKPKHMYIFSPYVVDFFKIIMYNNNGTKSYKQHLTKAIPQHELWSPFHIKHYKLSTEITRKNTKTLIMVYLGYSTIDTFTMHLSFLQIFAINVKLWFAKFCAANLQGCLNASIVVILIFYVTLIVQTLSRESLTKYGIFTIISKWSAYSN